MSCVAIQEEWRNFTKIGWRLKRMEVGDIVKKISGDYDLNKSGVVLSIETNMLDNTIVEVYVDGEIKNWYVECLEVIYDDKENI
jgi:hypothetical protein